MESCPTFNLEYERNNEYNRESTTSHLSANKQHYCQLLKTLQTLEDERPYF